MKLQRAAAISILLLLLAAFALADHMRRPPLDHQELEQWRISGAKNACAPCGAICTDDS